MGNFIMGFFKHMFTHLSYHPCVAKWSNLIFRYKFMVYPPVGFYNLKILRHFLMGKITVYMAPAVDLRCLVRFIVTLMDNSPFITPFPYRNRPLCCKPVNVGIL